MYDAPSGGRLIATFTGGFVPMSMSDVPPDPQIQRSKLSTRASEPSVRIDGYVDTTAISVWTSRDVPIVAGSIWIASAQKVKLTGAQPGTLSVEIPIFGSNGQVARTRASCDALALQRGTPRPQTVPGNGRGYLAKGKDIDIFDGPNGNAVFTLHMTTEDVKLFWSEETSGTFVHGMLRGELAIDGWIRKTDLNALPKGEMMDQYIPPETSVAGAQLVMDPPPRIARAPRDIPIRFRRTESETPIGVIEAGAEFFVLETIAGWTNILPTKVFVLPSEGNGFWIPASETPR
jgi:hypothetical protein